MRYKMCVCVCNIYVQPLLTGNTWSNQIACYLFIQINMYWFHTFWGFVFAFTWVIKWKRIAHTHTSTSTKFTHCQRSHKILSDNSVWNWWSGIFCSALVPLNSFQRSSTWSYKMRRSIDISKQFEIHIISDNTSEISIDWSSSEKDRKQTAESITSVFLQ